MSSNENYKFGIEITGKSSVVEFTKAIDNLTSSLTTLGTSLGDVQSKLNSVDFNKFNNIPTTPATRQVRVIADSFDGLIDSSDKSVNKINQNFMKLSRLSKGNAMPFSKIFTEDMARADDKVERYVEDISGNIVDTFKEKVPGNLEGKLSDMIPDLQITPEINTQKFTKGLFDQIEDIHTSNIEIPVKADTTNAIRNIQSIGTTTTSSIQEATTANNNLENSVEVVSSTGVSAFGQLRNKLTEFIQSLKTSTSETQNLNAELTKVSMIPVSKISKETTAGNNALQSRKDIVKTMIPDMESYNTIMQSSPKLFREEKRMINQVTMAQGQLMQQKQKLGVEAFRLGLGVMFLVISYQRVQAAVRSLTNAQRALNREYEDAEGLQEDAMRAQALYGSSSKQARDATKQYQRALEDIQVAEENVAYYQQQQSLTLLSLVLGSIPTAINAVVGLTSIIHNWHAAQLMATYGVTSLKKALGIMDLGVVGSIPKIGALTASFGSLATVMTVATGILGLVVGALTLMSMTKVTDNVDKTTNSFKEMDHTLVGNSLVPSLQMANEELNTLSREMDNVRGIKFKDLDVNITREADITASGLGNIPTMQRNAQVGTSVRDININFGEVTVRDDTDIDEIARKVSKSLNREVVNLSGGRTFI